MPDTLLAAVHQHTRHTATATCTTAIQGQHASECVAVLACGMNTTMLALTARQPGIVTTSSDILAWPRTQGAWLVVSTVWCHNVAGHPDLAWLVQVHVLRGVGSCQDTNFLSVVQHVGLCADCGDQVQGLVISQAWPRLR